MLMERTPYRLFRLMVDVTSFNYSVGQRKTHILPQHIRHQTALDYTRASSGIYNIPRTLPDLTLDLPRIQQPTLLVWGSRDPTLAPESFCDIEKALPNVVASHTMPICGHVPHQCHPDKFNPLCDEVFEQPIGHTSPFRELRKRDLQAGQDHSRVQQSPE